MRWISILAVVVATLSIYVFVLRPILARTAYLERFYLHFDSFWSALGRSVKEQWSMILARLMMAVGPLIAVLEAIQSLPWNLVPSEYWWVGLLVAGLGMVIEGLRKHQKVDEPIELKDGWRYYD